MKPLMMINGLYNISLSVIPNVCFNSESEEANKADNSVNLKIPLLYDAEIHLTR